MKKSSLKSRSRDKEEEEDFKKEQNDQMPNNTKAKKERDFVQIIAEAKNRALVKFDFSKKNVRKSQY
tara:strand:+ start:720 stop:920 length:201 start_codon:yes stop_codon:yes gene_type:complete